MERTSAGDKSYSEQRTGGMPGGRLREDGRVLHDVGEAFREAPGGASYANKNAGSFDAASFPCRGWQFQHSDD